MGWRLGRILALCAGALCLGVIACAQRLDRTLTPPERHGSLAAGSEYLKVHMRDGDLYVLALWEVQGTVVIGTGDRFDPDRALVEAGVFEIPISLVALFETNVIKESWLTGPLAMLTVVSGAVTVACLTNPKACFGSCPTFYVWDGREEVLAAEGFSSSVAPSLEASDVDALFTARPTGRRLSVRLTNEALETHVIRHADLLVAARPEGGRVVATDEGELWQALELHPPRSCAAPEGDCSAAVSAFDEVERASLADERYLATKEHLDLAFHAAEPGAYGLVLGARQTFLSTFLFYQALAYMGREVGHYLASLERGDLALHAEVRGIHELLGGIEVQVSDGDGGWRTVGAFDETGPIAADVQLVLLPEGVSVERLRLRLTKGHWRLGYVALARLGERIEPTRLRPTSAVGRVADAHALLTDDRRQLVTLPGDEYQLTYELPDDPERLELFLDSRGYYLEWIRDEWLKEESSLGVAMMLRAPRLALRLLAPAFKQVEPDMEEMFWSSRYAPSHAE